MTSGVVLRRAEKREALGAGNGRKRANGARGSPEETRRFPREQTKKKGPEMTLGPWYWWWVRTGVQFPSDERMLTPAVRIGFLRKDAEPCPRKFGFLICPHISAAFDLTVLSRRLHRIGVGRRISIPYPVIETGLGGQDLEMLKPLRLTQGLLGGTINPTTDH